ncbi:MAG: hypothetical protein KAW88_05390 [Candidatus Cloacimonetes bacterium]|nr:hypothetical protein [Candidatus Cloacimonadota bacterium]
MATSTFNTKIKIKSEEAKKRYDKAVKSVKPYIPKCNIEKEIKRGEKKLTKLFSR